MSKSPSTLTERLPNGWVKHERRYEDTTSAAPIGSTVGWVHPPGERCEVCDA